MKSFSILVFGVICLLAGCKSDSSPTPAVPVIQQEISVESITGTKTGDITATRKGFINLADGKAYSQTEAIQNADKVDFAYNYHGGGCPTCRFFENVKSMSTRTGYVSAFSTITDSRLSNIAMSNKVTVAAFDSVATVDDFDAMLKRYAVDSNQTIGYVADITNRTTDVAVGRIFAFKDKNGKLGLFKISVYTANVPTGDAAPLTLSVKIKP